MDPVNSKLVAQFSVADFTGCWLPYFPLAFFLSGCPNFRCLFYRLPIFPLPIFLWPKFPLPFLPFTLHIHCQSTCDVTCHSFVDVIANMTWVCGGGAWWCSWLVGFWCRSVWLFYAKPSSYWYGWPCLGSTLSMWNQLPSSTQPGHPFMGRQYKYQPSGGDGLQLMSKGRYGLCLVASRTVRSLEYVLIWRLYKTLLIEHCTGLLHFM